jgi:hypothetical protein
MFKKLSFILALIVSTMGYAETPLEKLIDQAASKGSFVNEQVLTLSNEKSLQADSMTSAYQLYHIDQTAMQHLLATQPQNIQLPITISGKTYTLRLTKTELHAKGFKVTTSGPTPSTTASAQVHYRGIVVGAERSLAAISFYENDVIGMFATAAEGNFVIGKLGNDASQTFIAYNDQTLKVANPFKCSIDDDNYVRAARNKSSRASQSMCRQVAIYYEADYKLYRNKGYSVTNVTNFINGMFNSVATIYLNEHINLVISDMYIWNTADSFSTTSSSDALSEFTSLRQNNINGNLAQLLAAGGSGLGGIAWLDVFCSNYPESYANIGNSYSNFPTYSWNIEVMSHEMGHNFGSPHTHNCNAWIGGPIDGCGPTYDPTYAEGTCPNGPLPIKGTIMSYCHLVSSVGINLALGFGPQPGDLIRTSVINAVCLDPFAPFSPALTADTSRACAGDTIAMKVTPIGSNNNYQWLRNGGSINSGTGTTHTKVNATLSGSYTCVVTDSNGCEVQSNLVSVQFFKPTATITVTGASSFCRGDSVLLTATSQASYLWSTLDTTRSIWVRDSGSYSVTVVDTNGCSATSLARAFTVTTCTHAGISQTGSTANVEWYPNPVSDMLTIVSDGFKNIKPTLSITNVAGQMIMVNTDMIDSQMHAHTSNLAAGAYLATVKMNGEAVSFKFIKQ